MLSIRGVGEVFSVLARSAHRNEFLLGKRERAIGSMYVACNGELYCLAGICPLTWARSKPGKVQGPASYFPSIE